MQNALNLKTRIFLSFFTVLLVAGISVVLLECYVIKRDIIERAQTQVKNDLKAAGLVFQEEMARMSTSFDLVADSAPLTQLKDKIGLDYFYIISVQDNPKLKSDIARQAILTGKAVSGTRLIDKQELLDMGPAFYKKARIDVLLTPRARPSQKKVLETAMAMEVARPVYDATGHIQSVIGGGRIINRDFGLVDKIRDLVFEDNLYKGRPVGTVTVFQDDVRIATNVLNEKGERAIGTRVSEAVYKKVVENKEVWVKRAFVVTDWYLTGYAPLYDIKGNIIGILYVGLLEKPYMDMARNIFLAFFVIILFSGILAIILTVLLTGSIVRPITDMLGAAERIAGGDLQSRVKAETSVKELNILASSFNKMAERLDERQKSLKVVNERLTGLNKNYLDLICFVSHELKAIISSLVLNVYTIKEECIGSINPKQRKIFDSMARHLDYFSATVKNFFDLGRIEKGELMLHKVLLTLKEDVFGVSLEVFSKPAAEKGMKIVDTINPDLKINGDVDLLCIVANNLIGNAVKYGSPDGEIKISAVCIDHKVRVEVYNDGDPIPPAEKEKLFKKFSRLDTPQTKLIRGTGLGLFIAKEIIKKHKGQIWLEARGSGNAFIFEIEKEVTG